MRRGELYLVSRPSPLDPRKQRVFLVVSRQLALDSNLSTAICVPVYSNHDGLRTQVAIGIDEGMKHESSVHCDELHSIPIVKLTRYVGSLGPLKMSEVDRALARALGIDQRTPEWVN